ncbi:putative ribonuclease H-like domain-containing protein [Tanacetum coccineum]
MAEQDIPPPTITAMKIPIIRKGEYDIWSMRMRQYICHTDHNLWDVIVNGDLEEEPAPTGETSAPPAPKTAKQLAAKRNQERVKSILLLAIPDEYLLKFHNVADAKSLWEAIKSSQLEVHGAPISKEDINEKFLRSLLLSWNKFSKHTNKPDIDEIDIDDLYNNLGVYEDEMKRSSSSTPTSQNLAFLSSENTSSTNELTLSLHNQQPVPLENEDFAIPENLVTYQAVVIVVLELAAKVMDDVSRQAFEEEKRKIASQKKAAQATSTNILSTDRQSFSTDRPSVCTDRPFVSTDRPSVCTAILPQDKCALLSPAHPNKVYKVIKLFMVYTKPKALRTLSFISDGKWFQKRSMCTEFEDCMHKRFQMSSMGELTFFLGLQVKQQPNGIFISQDKYVADILKKFDFLSIRTATTPIESNKPLVKDEDGLDVDVHIYRDSPFEVEAYSDSYHGGASLNRKSTTGGCQFLGRRLISWQCKKQTIVVNSTTKAEYVAATILKDVPVPLDHFPVPTLTKKVLTFMVKKGKNFSGKVTPLFDSMLVQQTKDEGEASERPSDSQPIPSPPHPSEDQPQTQTDPSPRPSPSIAIPDSNPEGSGGNHGGQSSSDRSLSGNEDGLTLQSVYDLCISLCTQVSAQAKEIKALKAQVKKLKKGVKPLIIHYKTWMKSVALKKRLARKASLKKKGVHKEYVSKQGRKSVKSSKGKPSVHKDLAFDDLDDDEMDYMETEDAQNEGRTSSVVLERRKVQIRNDDETITQVLITMSQNKQKEKEKGVEIRNVEDTESPRPTSTRSVLTLKPLPKIVPKDKGKKMINEEGESDTESYDITEAEKSLKFC